MSRRRATLGLLLAAALAHGPAEAAPVRLTATDVHGRPFSTVDPRGRVVVLVLISRHNREASEPILRRLRPLAASGRVSVAGVIDFGGIPRMFHGFAERRMRDRTRASPIHYIAERDGRIHGTLGRARGGVEVLVLSPQGELERRFDGTRQLDELVGYVQARAGEAADAGGSSR